MLNLNEYSTINPHLKKRELEKNASLFVLSKQLGSAFKGIGYENSGKPFLIDSDLTLSISHSHGLLAIIVSNESFIGIDIELIREKITALKTKFLSDVELNKFETSTLNLTYFWACKEAAYKAIGEKNVSFKNQLYINKFEPTSNFAEVIYYQTKESKLLKKEINLNIEYLNTHVMAFTC
ncbi:MAG: 4'-phosphopantetheinyl transferase superfamily protein [Bacteroidetes bacterium]|nr:4'-phosphopantetheinyl transferase superfamily protein [Bacteroidota bacterium]